MLYFIWLFDKSEFVFYLTEGRFGAIMRKNAAEEDETVDKKKMVRILSLVLVVCLVLGLVAAVVPMLVG